MNAARSAFFAVLMIAACQSRHTENPPSPQPARPSYLTLMDGLVIVDRSGESQFANSALNAIDGMPDSLWTTPPGDPRQDLTILFPARTRLTGLGISNGKAGITGRAVSKISAEWSSDGLSFQPLQTIAVTRAADDQLFDTNPVEAIAIRVTILDSLGHADIADFPELLIQGTELEAVPRPSIEGRWKLNQLNAELTVEGDRVLGLVEMDPPMLLDGAWHGRMVRFAWVRDKQFGVGVLIPDRSGRKLNGIWWFREAIPPFFGHPWFGERTGEASKKLDPFAVAEVSLTQRQTYPLYQLTTESAAGIDFIKELMARRPGQNFRIIANEVHGPSPEADLRATEKLLESVRQTMIERGVDMKRITFSPVGRRFSREPNGMPFYVRLHSRADLEVIEK